MKANDLLRNCMQKSIKYICAFLLVIGTSTHSWGTGIYLKYGGNTYYTGSTITITLNEVTLPSHGSPSFRVGNDAGWTQDTYSRYGVITSSITGSGVSFLLGSYTPSAGEAVDPDDNEKSYYTYNASAQYWYADFQLGYYFTSAGTNNITFDVTETDQADGETVLQSATFTIRFVVNFTGYTITYNLTGLDHASVYNPTHTSGAFHAVFDTQANYDAPITGTYSDGFVTNEPITIGSSGDCYYNLGDLYYNNTPSGNVTITLTATKTCTSLTAPTGLTLAENKDGVHGKTRFGWNSVANASGYKVTVSNGVTTASVTTASDRYYYITTFPVGNYTWSVSAIGDGNTYCEENEATAGSSFCVGADLSAVTPSNLEVSSITNTTATISWDEVANAVSYTVWVMNEDEDAIIYDGSTTSTSFTATGLTAGTTFVVWWEANNSCAGDGYNSAVDNSLSFTTTNNHTVSFNANGGSSSMDDVVRTHGSSYELPACTFMAPSGKVFKCWAEGSASGTERAIGYSHTVNADITFYAKWRDAVISDYVFSCAELTLTEHLATASAPIFMTSAAGKKVRSQDYITITGNGLTPSTPLTFPGLNSKFEVKKADGSAISTEADGTINVNAYIYYTPDVGDTDDGLDKMTSLTVSVGGGKPKSATLTHDIIGRHVPANFVIAVKNGASWYALPANMTTSTPAPEPIVVDNNSSPTMAYTSDDNIFTLYGQHNSFMTTGGEYIKLAMHGQSNAPMAAADGTGSKIGKSIAINIENNIGNDYWWLLTQTNTSVSATTDVKYNVTIGNSNTKFLRMWPAASGGAKWGMYAYGINEIRLIPATAVTEMDLDIFEWGTEAIVIKYNGSGTLDGANVAGTNASSAELVDMPGDLKKITNLAGLSSNPSGLLAIRINDGGVKQALLPIPFIITGTKTDAEVLAMVSDDAQAAAGTDVVILNGGYLKQSSERTFNNIHIYGGGKDSVGNNLTTQNIYLHGGFSWLTNSFALPQMKVKDGVNIVSPEAGDTIRGIYYDLTLNNSMYYVTALPKTVAVADITNEEGTQKFSAWMKRYSGKGRTLSPKESGWIRHGETAGDSIKRGIGYEIAIKPRKSRSYGVLRFPLLKDTIWSDETNCAPPIVGWGYSNDAVAANNKGWNLLGNPFFSAYNNTTEDATRIEQRGLVQHKEGGAWTGTYDFNESTVRYFTIPNYTDEDYRDVRANPYKLDAFYPFFVQAKVGTEAEPGSLSFGASGRALKAPSILRKHILDREIIVDFMLRDENDHTDAAGLTINNEYTDEFDMDDKEKTIENGTQFMKVYTLMDGHRIAFNALPEETAQGLIPVGYIAPTSGTYTFTLPQGDYPELAHLWLIDNELNTQTDLLLEEYDFQTGAGQNDTRFTINLALSDHKTPTDIENVDGGNNGHKVNLPEKFIYQDNLYIRHNGILYDGTGKRIR